MVSSSIRYADGSTNYGVTADGAKLVNGHLVYDERDSQIVRDNDMNSRVALSAALAARQESMEFDY